MKPAAAETPVTRPPSLEPRHLSRSSRLPRTFQVTPSPRLPRALGWLAALLVIYLVAPLLAVAPPLTRLDWHQLASPMIWRATWISLASATAATLLIGATGIPLGLYLARHGSRASRLIGFMVQFPLAMPPLMSGIVLLFLVGPYTWLGAAAARAGIELTDSFAGIVLAQTFVAAPFLIIAARSAFAANGAGFEDVAATLGHGSWSRFWTVSLPMAWPSICAGLLLAWLRAFGEFGATVMLAYHPYSLPVYTYVAFGSDGLSAMLPLLAPTLACALLVLAAAGWLLRPRRFLSAQDSGNRSARELTTVPLPPGAGHAADPEVSGFATRAGIARAGVDGLLTLAFTREIGDFTLEVAFTSGARRIAILGSSGSGKSMTLRVLAGLDSARTTAWTLGDRNLAGLRAEHRAIAYVPQNYGLFPHLTVARQMVFGRHADHAEASRWSRLLGIADLMEHRPGQLSLGQQQRVALVRALAMPSALLLLDEPFSALDAPLRARLRNLLRALQRQIAATTIIVTHDPLDAYLLADEVMVMHGGRILQQGPTQQVMRRPASLLIAALVGLANVFTARVDERGHAWLGGAGEPQACAPASPEPVSLGPFPLAPGDDYLLHIAPGAITLDPAGRHAGWITDRVALADTEQVSLEWGGVLLTCTPRRSIRLAELGDACQFDIDLAGVDIWRVAAP